MIIISQNWDIIIRSSKAAMFFLDEDADGNVYLAVGFGTSDVDGIRIGTYKKMDDAKKALKSLFNALSTEGETGQKTYQVE